jgi:N-acetylmuramoyl-L-alanine amidase
MKTSGDILFGRFTGQSKLKQGNRRIRLTPEPTTVAASGSLALLQEAVELEGSFGIVVGHIDGDTMFEAHVEEVIPPILSGVLDKLLKEDTIDAEAMLPKVERSVRSLTGRAVEPSSHSRPLCALVVGHRKSAKGAVSADGNVAEFDFNSELAAEIKKRVTKARVKIVFRANTTDGLRKLPAKVNAVGPHLILSLHCNAFNKIAKGTETLFFHTSANGKKLAKIVQTQLLNALELRNRGIREKKEADRGAHLLKFTKAPCVICEPFFIDNDEDLAVAMRRKKRLAAAYARAIDEAAAEFES